LAVGVSLGDPRLAGVEQVEAGIHRLTHGTFGLRTDLVPSFEAGR
jgi:hypothetical protein